MAKGFKFNNALAGAKINLISSQEYIRSEAYGVITNSGWENQLTIMDEDTSIDTILSKQDENDLFLFIDKSISEVESFIIKSIDKGVSSSNIIIAVQENSFEEKIFVKKYDLNSFIMSINPTTTLIEINLSSLPSSLIQVWTAKKKTILANEIEKSMNSGFLPLLESYLGEDLIESSIDRAHQAFAIMGNITNKITELQKVIKCALFMDIVKSEKSEEIIKKSRMLWTIKNELSEIKDIENQSKLGIVTLVSLASDYSIKAENDQNQDILSSLDSLLKKTSLKNRISIKSSVTKVFMINKEEGTKHEVG